MIVRVEREAKKITFKLVITHEQGQNIVRTARFEVVVDDKPEVVEAAHLEASEVREIVQQLEEIVAMLRNNE